MRLFDPHTRMYCRLTDDYERMALCGITTVVEPAFWLGTNRTHPESFFDYFEHITVFEHKRAARYGVNHYQCIGVNPKDAKNLDVTLPTVEGMRRFFDRPTVVWALNTAAAIPRPQKLRSLAELISRHGGFSGDVEAIRVEVWKMGFDRGTSAARRVKVAGATVRIPRPAAKKAGCEHAPQ